MEITRNLRKVQRDLRQQKLSESKICEVIPDFYEDKCGQFLYPLVPFDPRQWKVNPVASSTSLSSNRPKAGPPSRTSNGEEPWTYKRFEKKLSNGVLTIPCLNLQQVPKSIFEFNPPLRIIYLNDNSLRALPYNLFDDLPLLAWLDIRNNQITNLPELTKTHEALRTLLLQNNLLTSLPLTLHLAEQLTTIQLRGNPIVDPPSKTVENGTGAILKYLADRYQYPDIPDDDTISEDEGITFLPPVRMRKKDPRKFENSKSATDSVQTQRSESVSSPSETQAQPKSRALKALYSDALWRHVPHEGPTPLQLLASAQKEVCASVQRKLATQQEVILQRMRDREERTKFQKAARLLQVNGLAKRKAEGYKGPNPPFGIGVNDLGMTMASDHQPRNLGVEDFRQEFLKNWDRLNSLTSNPVPMNDVEKAKNRLKEVEEIQQKISNMRLSMKIPV